MINDFDPLDEYADLIEDVKAAGEVPEPSPLFWNYLSARVRDAVAEEPIARAWWSLYWRPIAAVVGVVSVAAFLLVRPNTPSSSSLLSSPSLPSKPASTDVIADVEVSEMWRMIEVAAPKVEMDSVRDAGLMPSQYATDQAIESLSPSEREALVRLLRKEMGVAE